MPRKPDVWQRGEKGPWYAWIDGKRVRVADANLTKPQARAIYYAMRSAPTTKLHPAALTVRNLLNLWIEHTRSEVEHGERSPDSAKNYLKYAKLFAASFGRTLAAQLSPQIVSRAINARTTWSASTRDDAIKSLKAIYRWGSRKENGYVPEGVLADLKRDNNHRREQIITHEEAAAVVNAANPCLAAVLRGLWLTGCRPGELYGLTVDRVDLEGGTWRVRDKNRRKTKREFRLIYLSPPALELSRSVIGSRTEGLVFVNTVGGRWNNNAVCAAMHRASLKSGSRQIAAYEFRHLWATDAIMSGMSLAIVAELMGHRDWKMLEKHYAHITTRGDDLRAAAALVRPR